MGLCDQAGALLGQILLLLLDLLQLQGVALADDSLARTRAAGERQSRGQELRCSLVAARARRARTFGGSQSSRLSALGGHAAAVVLPLPNASRL